MKKDGFRCPSQQYPCLQESIERTNWENKLPIVGGISVSHYSHPRPLGIFSLTYKDPASSANNSYTLVREGLLRQWQPPTSRIRVCQRPFEPWTRQSLPVTSSLTTTASDFILINKALNVLPLKPHPLVFTQDRTLWLEGNKYVHHMVARGLERNWMLQTCL